MILVTRDDIERWASSFEAKGELPHLVARLVYTTTPNNTEIRFPSGSAVFLSGWDGVVNCKEDTRFIPKGVTCIEIGTDKNPKSKSDKDFIKRKEDSLGFNQIETTYIFITPYIWKGKCDWIKDKQALGIWKEVKVYDGIDLEQWLKISLPTSKWFASKINKYPSSGFLLLEEYWEEWSTGPNGLKLSPELVIAGRKMEASLLMDTFKETGNVHAIRASTRSEAIAFIAAVAKLLNESDSERFLSKTIVIDNMDNFRMISNNNIDSLNLIADFDDMGVIHYAASKGHQILIPLNPEDDINKDAIALPTLDREGLIDALVAIGKTEDQARKYSIESGRNITILKKLLGFIDCKSDWYEKKNIHEILPILLVGRWNENFEGDIELVEILSGQKYDDYLVTLNRWERSENAPLMRVGNIWRLTSPLDLWTSISRYLTSEDLNKLKDCFMQALSGGNPFIDSDEQFKTSIFFQQKRKYSNWLREGLTQSLIMVGLRGDSLKLYYAQNWVDEIVHDLLFEASPELWISLNKDLPLIAEASPKSFLNAVEHSLEKENPELQEMFKEEKTLFDSNYHYTGLLWALEGLAWFKEHLGRVTLILLKLDRVVSELKWVNSPLNSLVEIFKPWHFQTLCTFEERMCILQHITSKEPDSGWRLLMKLLPQEHEVAHPTHKTRWRIFDLNTNMSYSQQERWDTYSFIINFLFNVFDGDEIKLGALIERSVELPVNLRKKVFDFVEKNVTEIKQIEYIIWNTIREILHHHRSYPDAKWSLPETELNLWEKLYNQTEPVDVVIKYKWLFDSVWPKYTEGHKRIESDNLYHERNKNIRATAAGEWIDQLGLNNTIALRKVVKEPQLLGDVLSEVIKEKDEILAICECLKFDHEADFSFIQAFIRAKSLKEGIGWVKEMVHILEKNGYDAKAISNLLVSVGPSKEIWTYVDSLSEDQQEAYWKNEHLYLFVETSHDAIDMINKLHRYGRFFSAIELCSRSVDTLPTDLLLKVLWRASIEDSNEDVRLDNYVIGSIFDELYKRDNLDVSLMKKIEWNYISFLDSHSIRKPKYLENELAENPSFFIEVIKWIYFSDDRDKYYKEKEGVSEEKIQLIARHSKLLLDTWQKIPGLQDDYSIDEGFLKGWIETVRELATEAGRQEVADMEIGGLLARYPEDVDKWPQESIFRIIEDLHSEELNRHYSMALFNKRGSSVRGAFDGGDIEREHARYFNKLADKYKNTYPTVSEIFNGLANTYLENAKRIDQQAELEGLEY